MPPPCRTAALLTAWLCAATGAQGDTRYELAADAGVTASTNPLLLGGSDLEALLAEASIEPGVTFTDARGSSLELGGTLTGRRYSRRYGEYLLGGARATSTYRSSERLSASATASYDREVSADVLTESVATTADPRSIRNLYAGRMSLAWRPNARSELRPSVAYEKAAYEDSILLADTERLATDLAFSRRLSEATTIGLRATAARNAGDRQPDIETLALLATLDRRLGHIWRLTAEAGGERLGAFQVQGGPRRSARWLFSGHAALCGDGERTSGCIEAGMASAASGLGGLERRLSARASLSRRLNARLSLNLLADYQRSSLKSGLPLPDLESMRAQAGLEWRPGPATAFTVEGGYQRRDIGAGPTPDAAFLGLRFRWRSRFA